MIHKKILLLSRDPGGANTIIPLVRPLQEKGYETRLFGKDVALEKYLKSGLSGINIMNYVKNIDSESIREFLIKERPDFIITGTSSDDFTEKYLWKVGEELGIPSFAIIDQWINYGIRFSKYKSNEISEYNSDNKFHFLPSKILIMDEYAKEEAIKEGLDTSRLIVTGQPHFENILKYKETSSQEFINNIRRKLDINNSDFLITFASEPISKDYCSTLNHIGYTEKTILEAILEKLEKITFVSGRKISVIIKLHPRENIETYHDIISFKYDKINIHIDKTSNPFDLILASDLICGMSSMFLIESVILGKPIISVQIGLNKENPFILDRRGIMKSIMNNETLLIQLNDIIIKNKFPQYNFNIIKTPVKNVIFQMENYSCQY